MNKNSAFLGKMEELVKQVVNYYGVPCYLIDSTIETHNNAYGEKVNIPVIRIVGFFEDTISKVTYLLNNEFELRIIKDEHTSADAFTSSAQTYQAGLKPNRLELAEYKILNPHKFEIRVSSILQDVYNAMQKGLSNGSPSLPDNVKRDFYRVGAFLEMADIEFVKMRDNARAASGNTGTPTLPNIPEVSRDTQPVATAPVVPPSPPVAQAAPALVPEMKVTPAEAEPNKVESMDMSVDSFNSLAVGINNIEQKNNVDDNYLDLMTSGNLVAQEPKKEETINPTPAAETKPAGDGVALNIDNIETFNMNVSGMIERTTEIIRDGADKNSAFGNLDAEKPQAPVDENAQMNEATLKEYVKGSKLVKEVDAMIAERAGAKINEEIDIEGDVDRLRFLKVFTLKQLNERIADNKEDIVAFAEKWIGKDNGGSFDSGICLFYLEYLIVGKKNDPAFAVEYVLKFISDNDYSARYIIPTYNSIRQNGEPATFAHLTLK